MIRCDSEDLFNEVTKTVVRAPCSKKVLSFEDSRDAELCDWKDLFYYVRTSPSGICTNKIFFKFFTLFQSSTIILTTSIPVGNKNFYFIVYIVTLFVSWLGCYHIFNAIRKKSNLNKKM